MTVLPIDRSDEILRPLEYFTRLLQQAVAQYADDEDEGLDLVLPSPDTISNAAGFLAEFPDLADFAQIGAGGGSSIAVVWRQEDMVVYIDFFGENQVRGYAKYEGVEETIQASTVSAESFRRLMELTYRFFSMSSNRGGIDASVESSNAGALDSATAVAC